MKISIREILDVDSLREGDRWVAQLLPLCRFEVVDQSTFSTTVDDGGIVIRVPQLEFVRKFKQDELLEAIKHELCHVILGHCEQMASLFQKIKDKGLSEWNRHKKVLGICQDCSVHYKAADPVKISQGFTRAFVSPEDRAKGESIGVYTYENTGIPVLPPMVAYEILINDHKDVTGTGSKLEGMEYLGCIDPTKDAIDYTIARVGFENVLREYAGEIPDTIAKRLACSAPSGSRPMPDVVTVEVAKWVRELMKLLTARLSIVRNPSYRRDPHEGIGGAILKRGHSSSFTKKGIVLAIDASGSINTPELNEAISIGAKLSKQYKCEGSAIVFDSTPSPRIPLTDTRRIISAASTKGGGTRFQPVLDMIHYNETVVFITDTYCSEHILDYKHIRNKPIVLTKSAAVSQAVSDWVVIRI